MKANELRIGNYLINELAYHYNEGLCQVTGIFHDLHGFKGYAIQTGEGNTTLLNDEDESYFKPIPLTEEWLVKFGFKKRKYLHLFNWENKIIISQNKNIERDFFLSKTGYDI